MGMTEQYCYCCCDHVKESVWKKIYNNNVMTENVFEMVKKWIAVEGIIYFPVTAEIFFWNNVPAL